MPHPLACASSASSPRSPCFETSLKPLLSPPLYLLHPNRLPASPPSGPPYTSRYYSSSQVPIRVPSCTHVPLLSLRSFPVPRACRCSPHTRHHTRVHPFACADSRSSRNLVRHPSLSRPRPCHTHWTPSFTHSSPHPTRLTQRVPLFISARRRARTCNGVLASGRACSLLPPSVSSVRYAFPISQQSPCKSLP